MNYESVNLSDVVGKGYASFWKFKGRYRVVKGSRASKKSKTTALNLIYRMMKYEGANTLVVRKTYGTLKDSCFAELKWAINRLGVSSLWDIKISPLELTYIPFCTKVFFRGLDDPLKITSITVDKGYLCFGWIEEAYEVLKEEDFNILDESIRGEIDEKLFKQWTITFNPWSDKHWLKKRFFDVESEDILAITTNYKCNEWLDSADFKVFDNMKNNNPRRYQVAGLGNWGIVDGLVFENWKELEFDLKYIHSLKIQTICGLDFGYTNDPSAFFVGFIDLKNKKLYVYDEFYKTGMSNYRIFEKIKDMGYFKENITADSSEPKSIDELRVYGLRVNPAVKGKDSINHGIQFLQDFEILIHPRCVNFITEISNYTFAKDKFGNPTNKPIDYFNHLMDAMRYAVEKHTKKTTFNNTLRGGI